MAPILVMCEPANSYIDNLIYNNLSTNLTACSSHHVEFYLLSAGVHCQSAMWQPCSTVYPPYPVSLASVYTTHSADGLCHISWPLNHSIPRLQNSSSVLASGTTYSLSHHDNLVSNYMYKLWVISLVTGLSTKVIAITVHTILASCLAVEKPEDTTYLTATWRHSALGWGTDIQPWSRSNSNPSHAQYLAACLLYLVVLVTNPALARSACTMQLVLNPFSLPSTTMIPLSKYTITRIPCPC